MSAKYHFVYETANTINSMFYIGKHSTDNLDDGYLGSGTWLNRSINKHGPNIFKRKILEFFNSSEEAYLYEKLILTEELVRSNKCYNLTYGGHGGGGISGTRSEESLEKTRRKAIKMWEDPIIRNKIISSLQIRYQDESLLESFRNKAVELWKDPIYRETLSNCRKEMWTDSDYRENAIARLTGETNPFHGHKHKEDTLKIIREKRAKQIFSKETREKISVAVTGEKNGFYAKHHTPETKKNLAKKCGGYTWVTNEIEDVQTREPEKFLQNHTGWRLGRVPKAWICKNGEVKRINKIELDRWLTNGWNKGRKS